MADLSDVKKTNEKLVEEATADMTGTEKFFDVTSAAISSKLMGGYGGVQTTKHLGRQQIELEGNLRESQKQVELITFQIDDGQYAADLEKIRKDTEGAIVKNDIYYNTQTAAATFANLVGIYQGVRNTAGYVKGVNGNKVVSGNKSGTKSATTAPKGKTTTFTGKTTTSTGKTTVSTGKTTASKGSVIKQDGKVTHVKFGDGPDSLPKATTSTGPKLRNFIKGSKFRPDNLFATGSNRIGYLLRNAKGSTKVIGGVTTATMPFIATYGLEGFINKSQQTHILEKSQDTMAMIAIVNEGRDSFESDGFIDTFDNFMQDFSTDYHVIEDQFSNGDISEEEYNKLIGDLNDKYQGELSNIVDNLSPSDQAKLQQWMDSTENTSDYQLDENVETVSDLNAASMYTLYGAAYQQMAHNNPNMELGRRGRESEYVVDEYGEILDEVSDECKEASNAVAEAVDKYKHGLADDAFSAFFKTLNARIVNACPMIAYVEAAFVKTFDVIGDKVMDLFTDGAHTGTYDGIDVYNIARNIRLDSAKQTALTDTYDHMMAVTDNTDSWMSQDYSDTEIYAEYMDVIAQADELAEVQNIVDNGISEYALAKTEEKNQFESSQEVCDTDVKADVLDACSDDTYTEAYSSVDLTY